MQSRNMIEHREMFMGEELVWWTTAIEPLPPSSQINPYGEDSTATSDPAPAPVRVAEKRPPSKAEWVRSFAKAGPLPACVTERRRAMVGEMVGIMRYFRDTHRAMPNRLVRALAQHNARGIAGVYDRGSIARTRHYFEDHKRRSTRVGAYVTILA